MLATALRLLSEAVFPARCIVCSSRGTPLCPTCRPELPYLPAGVCQRCSAHLTTRAACRGCQQLSPGVNTVRAAFAYRAAAREAVLTLKFRSGRYLAPLMGELLRQHLDERPMHADLVAAVPLSKRRLRERGYNQAMLLAEQVTTRVRGTLISDALERLERPPQQTLDAHRRLINLGGAFQCPRPERIEGKRVLLIDDVITTGATISACADVLADAGALRISALAFARDL